MSSNLWESGVPRNGILWFQGWQPRVPIFRNRQFFAMVTCGATVGNQEFQSLETAIPFNGNLRFRGWEPGVPISGNRQFLAMVTCGSKDKKEEFQPLGSGSSLQW